MSPKESYISLDEAQRAEVEAYARSSPGWQTLSQDSLPHVFPNSFRAKIDSAVAIVSGTGSGTTVLVFNALRVDAKAGAIDQEPFGIAVLPSGASTGGMFLHHGNWEGRTAAPPPGFWDTVLASGVGNYFYANPPSGLASGPLETLPRGHADAFGAVVTRLQKADP